VERGPNLCVILNNWDSGHLRRGVPNNIWFTDWEQDQEQLAWVNGWTESGGQGFSKRGGPNRGEGREMA